MRHRNSFIGSHKKMHRLIYKRPIVLTAIIMVTLAVLLGLIVWWGNRPKQIGPEPQDVTLNENNASKAMTNIFKTESDKLGQPLVALGDGTLDEITPEPCKSFRLDHTGPHGTAPLCEVSQAAHISLASAQAKRKFSDTANELALLLKQNGWKTNGRGEFNPESPKSVVVDLLAFISYINTKPIPVLYYGELTSWPLASYYKESYYPEIGRKATCSLGISTEGTQDSPGVTVNMDCSAYF